MTTAVVHFCYSVVIWQRLYELNITINWCNPKSSKLTIIDWFGIKKDWYKITFENPLEKTITIIWTIWKHGNNVIFHNYKCNPLTILEQARDFYHHTIN